MAFFAEATTEEEITEEMADVCAQAAFDEQVAFFSREKARSAGVKVGKHVHPYRPSSELSIEERKKRVDAVKQKSTCRACGKTGHWANDAICEMKGKKQHPFNKYASKGSCRSLISLLTFLGRSTKSMLI